MPSLQDFINTHLAGNSFGKSASEKEDEKMHEKKESKKQEKKEDEKEKAEHKKNGEKEKDEKKEEKKASSIEDAFQRAVSQLDPGVKSRLDTVAALQAMNIAKHANILGNSIGGGNMYGNGFAMKYANVAADEAKAAAGFLERLRAGGAAAKQKIMAVPGYIDERTMGLGRDIYGTFSPTVKKIRAEAAQSGIDPAIIDAAVDSAAAKSVPPAIARGLGYGAIGAGALGAAGLGLAGRAAYKNRAALASGARDLYEAGIGGARDLYEAGIGGAGDLVSRMKGVPTRAEAALAEKMQQEALAQEAYERSFGGRVSGAYNKASDTLRTGASHIMSAAKNPYLLAGLGGTALLGGGAYAYNQMTKEQSMDSLYTEGYAQALLDLGVDVNAMQKSASMEELARAYVGQVFDDCYNANLKKEASLFEYAALNG